jgi:hypothetical protein
MFNILTSPRQHDDRAKKVLPISAPQPLPSRLAQVTPTCPVSDVTIRRGGIAMNSRLTPALSDFAEGRWPEEREMNTRRLHARDVEPRDFDPGSMEPPLHPSEIDRLEGARWRLPAGLARWIPVALLRFMIVFFIGVGTTVAWQSYGNAARRMVAGLYPGLGWLAPAAPPSAAVAPGSAVSASPDQLAAISRSLAGVRQSVDRLTADITKLQAAKQDQPLARTPPASAPPPVASSTVQGRKPPVAQAAAR